MAKKQDLWDALEKEADLLKELELELPEKFEDVTVAQLEERMKAVEAHKQEKDNGKEKPESKGGKLLQNLRKNPVSVAGVKMAPEGKVELSKEQLDDKRLMAKIERGVETGMWKWVK